MKKVILTVTLTLKGPLISGSSGAGAFGVDLPFARTSKGKEQYYFIPATHVKGRLREAMNDLSRHIGITEENISDWLGQESDEKSNDQPMRGSLIFKDFIIRSTVRKHDTRNRISINEETGAVKKGAFMVIDAPFETAESVECEGEIRFFSDSDEKITKIKDALGKALRWIPALGAQRSVGYGALIGVEMTDEVMPLTDSVLPASSGDTLRLELTPDEPGQTHLKFIHRTIPF